MTGRAIIDDATLLDWLRRRSAGEDPRDIAPDRPDTCRSATNRVRRADLREAGEPENTVKEGYWA